MILNTGDVPNIYEHDEKAEIIEKVLHVSSFTGIQKVFLNPRSLDLFRPLITGSCSAFDSHRSCPGCTMMCRIPRFFCA